MNVAVCHTPATPLPSAGGAPVPVTSPGTETMAREAAKALLALGHRPVLVAFGTDAQATLRELKMARAKVALNLAGGVDWDGRNRLHPAALLDLAGLPYTGASPYGLALAQDKARTKDILLRHGLPTPRYHLVKLNEQFPKLRDLAWPLIVKPRFGQECQGIDDDSVVTGEKELQRAVRAIHERFRQGALIEEFVEGREIHATVLGNAEHHFLPAVEIRFAAGLRRPLLTGTDPAGRTRAGIELTAPAALLKREEFLLRDLVLRVFRLLEGRDYLRVDLRLRDGIPCIIDVNANPSLAAGGSVLHAARAAKLPLSRLLDRLLQFALARTVAPPA